MLRLWLSTALLSRRDACWKNTKKVLFSVSAITNPVSVTSILLLLLLLRKDIHLYFSVEVLRLLINFHFGCAAAAGGACAAYNITTEAERGAGYCFFLLRFCP